LFISIYHSIVIELVRNINLSIFQFETNFASLKFKLRQYKNDLSWYLLGAILFIFSCFNLLYPCECHEIFFDYLWRHKHYHGISTLMDFIYLAFFILLFLDYFNYLVVFHNGEFEICPLNEAGLNTPYNNTFRSKIDKSTGLFCPYIDYTGLC
jgi:hypothetical protein